MTLSWCGGTDSVRPVVPAPIRAGEKRTSSAQWTTTPELTPGAERMPGEAETSIVNQVIDGA